MKYAEYHKVNNFAVEKVTTLTKEPNPRNKSWKVVVPARLKEVMENLEMFPKGWITRAFTFHSGPRRQERGGQERKEQPRQQVEVQVAAAPAAAPAVQVPVI